MGLGETALDGQLYEFLVRHVAVEAEVIVVQRGTGGTQYRPGGCRHDGVCGVASWIKGSNRKAKKYCHGQ